ncbi:hypothetical protein HYX16_00125 [Candidatus Woesearchaeota archaeon]|nr:hypothetical protein [Candidatus Woesearchaeota archaeon]
MKLSKKIITGLAAVTALLFYSYFHTAVPKEVYEAKEYVKKQYTEKEDDYKKVIIHCHTGVSHDSRGTIEDVVAAAESSSIDFVILTDHTYHGADVIKEQKEGYFGKRKVGIIKGIEISRSGGSILALNPCITINKTDKKAKQIAEEVRKAGGLAFAGHIDNFRFNDEELEGYEILNSHIAFENNKFSTVLGFIDSYLFLPKEFFSFPLVKVPDRNLNIWDDALKKGRHVTGIAGNDVHIILGVPFGYSDSFSLMSNHVKMEHSDKNDFQGDKSELLKAIKKGNLFFSFDVLAESSGFEYKITTDLETAVMGNQIKKDNNTNLYVRTPAKSLIRIIRNGDVIYADNTDEIRFKVNDPGAYRVEAMLGNLPWIFSNPIYVNKN